MGSLNLKKDNMKIAFFDTHTFEREAFTQQNKKYGFQIDFLDCRLTSQSANSVGEAKIVCSFVNDKIDASCLQRLSEMGVRLIALRSAGFSHVDLMSAQKFNIRVCRVPGYSPYAVAEFTLGLLLTLNRKIHRAYNRVRELNFSLDGLVGFDLHGKTVGVIGAGKIGRLFAQMVASFGCRVLIYDLQKDFELEKNPAVSYTDLQTLCRESDVISLHVPLTPKTRHLIDHDLLSQMKPGVFLINTGRGALIDAKALIDSLKSKQVGAAALDVYEEEEEIFFHDLSNQVLQDDTLARLLTFPNVLITSHQAFLTQEALNNIAETTLDSIARFINSREIPESRLLQNRA